MATDYELALMSQQVYQSNGGIVRGWKVKHSSYDNKSGFGAAEYFNDQTNETGIAFRGTDPGNDINLILNLYTDARMFLGLGPNTLKHATDCYDTHCQSQNILSQIWNWLRNGSHTLTFTGHSLGGALAELITYQVKIERKRECKAVTFDSPGCANLVPKEHHETLFNTIKCYKSAPNWINTLNPPLGTPYRLYISHVKELDLALMAWCVMASFLRFSFYILMIGYCCNIGFGLQTHFAKHAFTFLTFGLYFLTPYLNQLLGLWFNCQTNWLSNQHSIDTIVSQFNNSYDMPLLRGDVQSWPTFWQYKTNIVKHAFVNLLPYSNQTFNIFTLFRIDTMLENQVENTIGYNVTKMRLNESK